MLRKSTFSSVVLLGVGHYFSITKNYELLLDIEADNIQTDIENVTNVLDKKLKLLENISMQYTGYFENGILDLQDISKNMQILFDEPCGVAWLHEKQIKQRYAVNIQDTIFSKHIENILNHIDENTDAPGKQIYFFSESYGSKLDWLEFVRIFTLKNKDQLVFVYKIDNSHTWPNVTSEAFSEYSDRWKWRQARN